MPVYARLCRSNSIYTDILMSMQRAACNEPRLASPVQTGKALLNSLVKRCTSTHRQLAEQERVRERGRGQGFRQRQPHTFGIMLPHTKLKPPTHGRHTQLPLLNTHTRFCSTSLSPTLSHSFPLLLSRSQTICGTT